MKTMFCDFETYSEQEIKYGSFRYAMDPTTEITCLAYGLSKENVKLWKPGDPPPTELIEHIKNGGLIRAWNGTFEYAIFNYVGARLHGWPKLKIEQVRCTQADALALALPAGLGQAAEALGTSEGKDKRGKLLIQRLAKPRKPTANKPYTRITPDIEPEMFQEFYEYCIQDVKTEISIKEMLPREITGKELDLFHLTLKINERGIPIDTELVDAILVAKAQYEKRLNKEVEVLTNGELKSTASRPKSLEWLSKNGLRLPGYTKGDIKNALEKDNLSDEVRRFLEIRAELSRTPIKKFDFIKKAICPDGTLKNNIIYHKATTGRYAGAGFQIQNLPRDTSDNPEELIERFLKSEELEELNVYAEAIKLIRSSICAPKDQKLVVSDFASIENRVVAWLAEDWSTLDDFRKGLDQYITAASSIYGVEYDDVEKNQRQLGKISVLSCVFGGGWKTFKKVCEESWGISITEDESKMIVDGYRKKYYKVVQFWYGLYDAALDAVTRKGVPTSYKSIKFRMMGDFLYMRLPSGRKLAYYKPELRMVTTPWGAEKLALTHMGQNTYTRKWERLTVIPGRLTENVVQATARDMLTEAMLKVEDAGYNIVGCVHDEIISQVDENFGSIQEFDKIMAENPIWALDCPIEVDGFEGKRYRK